MILMLDIDLAILRCPDESFELPPEAVKRGVTGQKHGTKVKDRYSFAALLSHDEFVRQVCWETSDEDVTDRPSESPSIVSGTMGVSMETVRSSRNDCEMKGHARKDCLKFSAWLAGYQRCKSELRSDTEKLECAPNRPRSRFHDHWRRGASQGDCEWQLGVATFAL